MVSLSIIILNHNTFEITRSCLDSIFRSDLDDIDLEVIVVDNGSEELQDKTFKDLYPSIVYLETGLNLGFAKANNLGLCAATKDYVLLLNSDTIISDPQTFLKCIEVLRTYDDRVVLTTRLLSTDGQSQVAYGFLPSLTLEICFTLFLYKMLPLSVVNEKLVRFVPDKSRVIDRGYITATYYLFRKSLLEHLPEKKLYDKTFLYGEELFWATQWNAVGIKMFYLADVAIIHLIGQSSARREGYKTLDRRRYQIEAEDRYLRWRYRKHIWALIYFFRFIRYCVLSPFDRDIRMRLVLLVGLFTKKG